MCFKCVHALNQLPVFRQRIREGQPRARINGSRTAKGCDAAQSEGRVGHSGCLGIQHPFYPDFHLVPQSDTSWEEGVHIYVCPAIGDEVAHVVTF